MNPLREPLEQLLEALAPLNVMGKPLVSLDTTLNQRVIEAVQALTDPVQKTRLGAALELTRKKGETEKEWRGRIIAAAEMADEPLPEDVAVCTGCGTYPKGYYTCATCSAADEHEGPQEHVSDWPERI